MLSEFPLISIKPGVRSGKACIAGTRITIIDILEWLSSGMTFEEIINDFPQLSKESIQEALRYVADRERSTTVVAA